MNGFSLLACGDTFKLIAVPNIPGYEESDLTDALQHSDDTPLYRPSKILQQIQVWEPTRSAFYFLVTEKAASLARFPIYI